jgi:hypothetical protein
MAFDAVNLPVRPMQKSSPPPIPRFFGDAQVSAVEGANSVVRVRQHDRSFPSQSTVQTLV